MSAKQKKIVELSCMRNGTGIWGEGRAEMREGREGRKKVRGAARWEPGPAKQSPGEGL